MDKSFQDILFGQARADDMSIRSAEDMTAAVRGEFSNAESLIAQAHESGFSLSALYRLQRAAELLSSSDMSVEDIAFEIGYKVPSALYKRFNAHFGMSPTEYRNALLKR